MAKGMLHTHLLVVIVFLISFLIKTVLLFANNENLLEKVRAKTKVLEMILGTLILVTGVTLLVLTKNTNTYMIGKIIIVLLAIPLGIVGMKKKSKPMSLIALFAFIYVYGVAETKSLKFKKDKLEIDRTALAPDTIKTSPNDTASSTTEILSQNMDAGMSNAKAIYDQVCQNCHGKDGKLMASGAKNLATSTLSDEEKKAIISNGKGLMQGYKNDLSEQEIDNLVRYVNTFKQ